MSDDEDEDDSTGKEQSIATHLCVAYTRTSSSDLNPRDDSTVNHQRTIKHYSPLRRLDAFSLAGGSQSLTSRI